MTAGTTGPTSSYRPEIDGLRAIAILLVAIFHFRLLPMGEAGFIGVDIFFVISGFLITRILMRDLDEGRFSLGRFYVARLRRLMPALVATLILYLLVAAFVFLPAKFMELAREALLTQLYVVNVYFWQTINYFGLRADRVPLLHMWSLSIEEQFYLFYPLILALVFGLRRGLVLPLLAVTTLGSFALGWWATGWKPEASFYLLPTRAWELAVGALLAILRPRAPERTGPGLALAGLAGAGLIVLALVIHTPVTAFPGWFAALPVLGAALLILAGPHSPTGRVLTLKPMLWIGLISYPVYLVHWPIIQLMQAGLPSVDLWHRWAGFAASFAIAWVIWRFVERPVRQGQLFRSGRAVLGGAAGAFVLLGGFCGIVLMTQGLPSRIPAEARAVLAYADDLPVPYYGCEYHPETGRWTPCPMGRKTDTDAGPVRVALVGDSHAQAMAGAVDQWLDRAGQRGLFQFFHGCTPVAGYGPTRCRAYVRAMIKALRQAPDIDLIVVVSAWHHDPASYDGVWEEGSGADAAFAAALDQTLAALAAPGRRIVLVDPMYHAEAPVPQRLAQNAMFGRDLPVDRPLTAHNEKYRALHGMFDAAVARHDDVARVSLISELCAGGTCRAVWQGTPLFSDGNHIRFGVSDYFADRLQDAIPLTD